MLVTLWVKGSIIFILFDWVLHRYLCFVSVTGYIYLWSCMVVSKWQSILQACHLHRGRESYETLGWESYSYWSVQMPWRGVWTFRMCVTSSVMMYQITSEHTYTVWEGQQGQETKVTRPHSLSQLPRSAYRYVTTKDSDGRHNLSFGFRFEFHGFNYPKIWF